MKAILMVDLPNDVNMDRVIQTPVALSFNLGDGIKQILFADGYLKPLPQKKTYEEPTCLEEYKVSQMLVMANADGWNACIDELLGETE